MKQEKTKKIEDNSKLFTYKRNPKKKEMMIITNNTHFRYVLPK